MEQSKGPSNNIVNVLMDSLHVDLQGAFDIAGCHFKTLMDRFASSKRNLPSWGVATDAAVSAYVMAMGHWVVGNLEWSFASQRYFGPEHAAIKESLVVSLRPLELESDSDDE